MKTYYITQIFVTSTGQWRSSNCAPNRKAAEWAAKDKCDRKEYGKYACKKSEVRVVEVEAENASDAFAKANRIDNEEWNVTLLHKGQVIGHKIAKTHDEAMQKAERMLAKRPARMDVETFIAPA